MRRVPGTTTLPQSAGPTAPEQTPEEVEAWIRQHAQPGNAVVILYAQRNLSEYRFDEIDALDRRRRRIHVVQHGSFDLRGIARRAPDGVVLRLLRPSPDVVAAATEGQIWINGRPVFRRPLTAHEKAIVKRIRGPVPAA
jgi:hypothetical protein